VVGDVSKFVTGTSVVCCVELGEQIGTFTKAPNVEDKAHQGIVFLLQQRFLDSVADFFFRIG